MFEDGKWQPLRPFYVYNDKHMKNFGLTEFSFGPEIGFDHAIAEAWPNETNERYVTDVALCAAPDSPRQKRCESAETWPLSWAFV